MLSFAGNLRVFVAVEPCDMRKSFNGLHAVVLEKLREDPVSGALFAFTNKRRNRLKLLYWDGTGLWVLAKRLEQGHFSWPKSGKDGASKIKLAPEASHFSWMGSTCAKVVVCHGMNEIKQLFFG